MKTPRGTARKERRAYKFNPHGYEQKDRPNHFNPHDYDEDAVCIKCGFDGAEWHHWKHNTYEGLASNERIPICNHW